MEREVCPVMLEGFFIQTDNVIRAAFMFRVAGLASLIFLARAPAVEALMERDVRGHILVAVQAYQILFVLVESRMAFWTLPFVGRVGPGQWPGHDEQFDEINAIKLEQRYQYEHDQSADHQVKTFFLSCGFDNNSFSKKISV